MIYRASSSKGFWHLEKEDQRLQWEAYNILSEEKNILVVHRGSFELTVPYFHRKLQCFPPPRGGLASCIGIFFSAPRYLIAFQNEAVIMAGCFQLDNNGKPFFLRLWRTWLQILLWRQNSYTPSAVDETGIVVEKKRFEMNGVEVIDMYWLS